MYNKTLSLLVCTLVVGAGVASASTIVVNTKDNTDFGTGKTNLIRAITLLADGDTIAFNIPGAGPHYLVTPTGGYPVVAPNNVVIDGYSQPGSAPNSNTMLAANNAAIRIVLDSRNGEGTSHPGIGFGDGETAVLFLLGTNCHVRGLCFLGGGNSAGDNDKAAININDSAHSAHISGCWIGVDVDGTTLAPFDRGPTAFGGTVDGVPYWPSGTVIGVKAGAADTAGARAQQNVIVGAWVNIFLESLNMVIAGNKLNVLPDGMHDVDQTVAPLEAIIETGRVNNNMRVGTDGDGLNDAEERNVFGGVTSAGDDNIIEIYGQNSAVGACTNIVIAGNYFGVAVDGVTLFTNSMVIVNKFTRRVAGVDSDCQFGSDFDGVSDDIEANVVYMNNPFTTIFPDPTNVKVPKFCELSADGRLSLRGNKLINNNLVPFSYADGTGGQTTPFVNYSTPYMDTSSGLPPLPVLDPLTSIYPRLKGTFPAGMDPYTNIIIDVYQLDPEGWANGKTIAGASYWTELTDGFSYTNGFAQGSKYLGSFSVPNSGSFDVDISGLNLGPGFITVAANYSADPPRTHRGRTHTGNFANPIAVIPGGAATVGLTQIVPDTGIWYNSLGNYPTNGPVDPAVQKADNGNWEPYTTVLGDSTFLITVGTWADDQASQNFIVLKQPAAGGSAKIGCAFYNDAGAPFWHQINLSRQNGNPSRIAADKRYGAVEFITAAETSIGQLAPFRTVSRWSSNPMYSGSNRYVTEQLFALDPLTLAQTPVTNAWDYVFGPFTAAAFGSGADTTQNSRTGGRAEYLDNGNIVVMIDDKTAFLPGSDGEVTTFSIIRPDGSILKGPTLVDVNDIWDNMAAFRGGFAIRVHNLLYFYDNNGTLLNSTDINTSSGLSFNTGRADSSRIGSDIRSRYVYLAGQSPAASDGQKPLPIWVAIWDASTGAFAAKALVCDIDPMVGAVTDRSSVGVDALDRFCVAFSYRPTTDFTKRQVAARVLAFDGTSISYLTPTFFPFVNHENNPTSLLGLETYHPNVAMTPREILIAAKGMFNSTNNPAGGPDTAAGSETKLYTVISHPAPMPKPNPQMTVAHAGSNALISWEADAGLFVLQSRANVASGTWADVSPQPAIVKAGSRHQMTVPIGSNGAFFRLLRRW